MSDHDATTNPRANAEAFARKVLNDVFGQNADDATVERVASRIVNEMQTPPPPAPDADGAGQPAYGAKPLSPDEALLSLAGYMSESKYVCTKCGWAGLKDELRKPSENLGAVCCPRCPYTPMEVGPSEQLVKLCDGVRSLLARLAALRAQARQWREQAQELSDSIAAADAARDAAVGAMRAAREQARSYPDNPAMQEVRAILDAALAAPPAGAP